MGLKRVRQLEVEEILRMPEDLVLHLRKAWYESAHCLQLMNPILLSFFYLALLTHVTELTCFTLTTAIFLVPEISARRALAQRMEVCLRADVLDDDAVNDVRVHGGLIV